MNLNEIAKILTLKTPDTRCFFGFVGDPNTYRLDDIELVTRTRTNVNCLGNIRETVLRLNSHLLATFNSRARLYLEHQLFVKDLVAPDMRGLQDFCRSPVFLDNTDRKIARFMYEQGFLVEEADKVKHESNQVLQALWENGERFTSILEEDIALYRQCPTVFSYGKMPLYEPDGNQRISLAVFRWITEGRSPFVNFMLVPNDFVRPLPR